MAEPVESPLPLSDSEEPVESPLPLSDSEEPKHADGKGKKKKKAKPQTADAGKKKKKAKLDSDLGLGKSKKSRKRRRRSPAPAKPDPAVTEPESPRSDVAFYSSGDKNAPSSSPESEEEDDGKGKNKKKAKPQTADGGKKKKKAKPDSEIKKRKTPAIPEPDRAVPEPESPGPDDAFYSSGDKNAPSSSPESEEEDDGKGKKKKAKPQTADAGKKKKKAKSDSESNKKRRISESAPAITEPDPAEPQSPRFEGAFYSSSDKNSPSKSPDITPPRGYFHVSWRKMPAENKKVFRIGKKCYRSYISLIAWLRDKATQNDKQHGSHFKGIRHLRCSRDVYGFVQIRVVNEDGKSVRFGIKLCDMYVVAFQTNDQWYYFDKCNVIMAGFEQLKNEPKYVNKAGIRVGPESMNAAVNILANFSLENDAEFTGGQVTMKKKMLEAAEVFYLHLAEAARFYQVEHLVMRTLGAPEGWAGHKSFSCHYESTNVLDIENTLLLHESDTLESACLGNFKAESKLPKVLVDLTANFSLLSQGWFSYAIAGYKLDFIKEVLAHCPLKFKSVKSLRQTLALLNCSNLRKRVLGIAKSHDVRSEDEKHTVEERINYFEGERILWTENLELSGGQGTGNKSRKRYRMGM